MKDRLITIRVRSGEYDFGADRATFTVVEGGETLSVPIDAIEDIKSVEPRDETAQ
ncbi:hypothetical protein [Rhodoblastus sp.]|uniref:hypothetical protein n=1 Tax=Rhodoblastus sp. TaxID=1962975 RepID=UPI0025D0BE2B|nr:hypothetical protein [Rhodoblastus sp.]